MIAYTRKHNIPFLIDDTDWEIVQHYSWHISAYGYPSTRVRLDGKKRVICLHLFLLGRARPGFEWDHKDRDTLNNQRGNLEEVTHRANLRNSRIRVDNSSGVRGVSQQGTHWSARIKINTGRYLYLGYFKTFEEAVNARQQAEHQFWNKETV